MGGSRWYPRPDFAGWAGTPKGCAALGALVLVSGMAAWSPSPWLCLRGPPESGLHENPELVEGKLELVYGTHSPTK